MTDDCCTDLNSEMTLTSLGDSTEWTVMGSGVASGDVHFESTGRGI